MKVAMTTTLQLGLALTSALAAAPQAQTLDLATGHWVDLTHTFTRDAIYWLTAKEFEHETVFEGSTEKGFYYTAYNFAAAEHGGSHIDAPVHFAEGHRTVGQLPAGCIVLLNTGSSHLWPDKQKYMGTELRGAEAVAELHFPGLDPAAARWLVENRTIKAIGLDTPSIDYGQSTLFESHQILFAADIPALENVANLDVLPPTGAVLVAQPMKIAGGSGGPTRITAFIPV